MCSFVSQSTKYAFELEAGAPGELLASTLLLWTKTAATENIRCAAVNAICGLIAASEGAREKISSQNGLQIVADCLHTSKTENGVSACAQTLTALVRVSRDRRLLCCHRHAVIDLVQASQTRSEATSRKCAACLKEIALEYSCHQLLLRCSTVEATSIFLRKRPADAVVKLLLILWHNLSCTKSSWARFGPHLDILSVYLNQSAAAMQSLTLCILCNVLSHHNNCEHFARQTVFKSVMDRCSPLSALGVSTKACYTLQNALRFSAHCRQTFAEKGGVNMMMKLVLLYDENDIRESALTVSLMAIQQIPTESFHVLASITQLLEILSYDLTTFEVAARILKLLAFLAKTDDTTRQKIVAVNAINIVVHMFEIPDKLGDMVVLKHQKDGNRILALKLATAFMSLLSHSKKLLPRLASQGGLAMIISVLAEHSMLGLPEEIVVNASILLANFSADRQGLNDIVSTCGIPVILKSAVAIATIICRSSSELQSPFRMRKFPALKGLPGSPQGAIASSEIHSNGTIKSQLDLNLDIKTDSVVEINGPDATGPILDLATDRDIKSTVVETTALSSECAEPAAVSAVAGQPQSQMLVLISDFELEHAGFAADAAISSAANECSNLDKAKDSWLSLIGLPVASRTMKLVIEASVNIFESVAAVESCLRDVINRIEENSETQGVVPARIFDVADTEIDTSSKNSESCVSAKLDKGSSHSESNYDAAQVDVERANTDIFLRAILEEVVLSVEVNTSRKDQERRADDAVASDNTAGANDIDAEDIWGELKFKSEYCGYDLMQIFRHRRRCEMESDPDPPACIAPR